MELGLIGLGKMGGFMRERIRRAGHTVVGYDTNPDLSDVPNLAGLVGKLSAPRAVWVMVPAGKVTQDVVDVLGDLLEPGDLIVDGGNSRWTDDMEHEKALAAKGIGFVDCGVSGGVWGLDNGYALMCGGTAGAGHYAKMVHNGIEYAIMQAYAEGFELMQATEVVRNVPDTMNSWREGTVIRSWLLDLLCAALKDDPKLKGVRGYAEDSGEGRWTVEAGIEHAVALPAITAALFARFISRQDDSPTMKAVSAMRHEFGGHAVRVEGGEPTPTGTTDTHLSR